MNTITHALFPVVFISRKTLNEPEFWCSKRILTLALFGALPDLLYPHLSLGARYSSWTHGLPALLTMGAF